MEKLMIVINLDECAAASTYWYMQGSAHSKKGGVRYKKGGVHNIARLGEHPKRLVSAEGSRGSLSLERFRI